MSPSEDPENQLKNTYRFVWSDRPPGPGRFFQKKGYFVPHLLKGSPGHLGPARPPKTRIAYRDGGLPPSDLARANQFIIQARVYLEVQNLVCLFTKAARHIDLSCCPIRSNHGSVLVCAVRLLTDASQEADVAHQRYRCLPTPFGLLPSG